MDWRARKILPKGVSCRIMPPVQLPRQLKTLDDLLAQAEHYATYSIRNMGRVPSLKVYTFPKPRRQSCAPLGSPIIACQGSGTSVIRIKESFSPGVIAANSSFVGA